MKKELIAVVLAAAVLIALTAVIGLKPGDMKVGFEKVSEKKIPRELDAEILPEYRDLERALACKVGDTVYVIVTRGTKPTSGYDVEIDKIVIKSEKDKSKMIVFATFADPVDSENMAQIDTFPSAVVKTDLDGLPTEIQLKAEFAKS